MIRYRVYEETLILEEKEYTAYGVAAFDSAGELLCSVSDITLEKEKAAELARRCERLRLSPIHLKEVAEDFIVADTY